MFCICRVYEDPALYDKELRRRLDRNKEDGKSRIEAVSYDLTIHVVIMFQPKGLDIWFHAVHLYTHPSTTPTLA